MRAALPRAQHRSAQHCTTQVQGRHSVRKEKAERQWHLSWTCPVPLKGLPVWLSRSGGAHDPVGLHLSQYGGKSHQGLHWDAGREVWEQPRQKLGSRGASQACWRQGDGSGTCEQQASPACAPGIETNDAEAHSATAGDTATQQQWLQQLEIWAIDEMVEATEEQLQEAEAEQQEARAVGLHQAAQAQSPLAEAGGICVVEHCKWCDEKEQGGRSQLHEPWGVGGVAGVGKRPVSVWHMPNVVSEAGERGKVAKAEERKQAAKGFDLNRTRERLATVRAAEAQRKQREAQRKQ